MRNPKKPKAKPKVQGKKKSKPKAPKAEGPAPQVWRPGVDPVDAEEELEYDYTAYDCFHRLELDWPCLSCDIVRDGLGAPRATFPHTMFMVAGTQAATAKQNYIALLKLSQLGQGRHGKKPSKSQGGDDEEDEDESDDDMSDSDSDAEDTRDGPPPKMHYRLISHVGGINRVRSMTQQPGVVASWSDSGQVRIYDGTKLLNELAAEEEPTNKNKGRIQVNPQASHTHSAEGFALDWSPVQAGRLASGDTRKAIHTWEPKEGGQWQVSGAYQGHESSVEDIQWSPSEATVFASCSADHTIKIWDLRERTKPMLSTVAANCDVNVISWNRLVGYMLASGTDDGAIRIWDLRALAEDAFVSHLLYHKGAVTSVEWCPYESSMLASSGADGQILVWDLALERDPEEESALIPEGAAVPPSDLPAQLLFMHAGQADPKELHWHPQIPGLILSTGSDGFNVFKAANV